MKKLNRDIISIFIITLLMGTAYGFPGMVKNNSNTQQDAGNTTQRIIDLQNTTQSDQDIVLLQHLIEVDAVQLQSENKLLVRETLIFRNTGNKNFSGTLRTWVPDGASDIRVARSEMMTGGGFISLLFVQNGNIISWNEEFIEKNSPLPFLYVVDYKLAQEPKGTVSSVKKYSKKFAYPTLINYRYAERPGLPALIVRVTKPQDSSIVFLDENGNKIIPQDVTEDGNSVINRFSSPQFRQLDIEITKSAIAAAKITAYAGYVILGILILLVLSYPVIRKKSEKILGFEEKIKTSLKRKPEESEEVEEETVEEAEISEPEETGEEEEDAELSGKTKDELEKMKNEVLSELSQLEKDYSSGNLLDEEYEDLKKSHREELEKISKLLGDI